MRLVLYWSAKELDDLNKGKQMGVSFIGFDNVQIHFDPDLEEIKGSVKEPIREEITRPIQWKRPTKPVICEHCGNTFKNNKSKAAHLWRAQKDGNGTL